MSTIQFSLQARSGLDEIAEYISKDNPDAAAHWLLLVHEECELLSKHPVLDGIAPIFGMGCAVLR
jgi:plasmid stabilization system protein ParE